MEQQTKTTPVATTTTVEKSKRNFFAKLFLNKWVALFLGAWLILYTRPYYQFIFIYLRKYVAVILLGAILLFIGYKVVRSGKKAWVKILTSILILGFITSWFTPWVQQRYRELHMMYLLKVLPKKEIHEFPLTVKERIHPKNNIHTMGFEKVEATSDVTEPHLIHDKAIDSTQNVWCMAVQPAKSKEWQRLTYNIKEIFSVPCNEADPDIADRRHSVLFNTGESMMLDKNVYNAAIKALGLRYFYMEPDEVYYMHDDNGKPVQVISMIKWTGFLFPIPKIGGVVVISSGDIGFGEVLTRTVAGQGTFISADDFDKYKYLDGQNLFSESISRMYAESFSYLYGYENAKIYEDKAMEIPHITNDKNDYPFVTDCDWSKTSVKAKNGLYHYIGMEPIGKERKALLLSLFIPSDGRGTIYYYDHAVNNDGLTGVSGAPKKIESANKFMDWDNNAAVEFRPYVPDIPELKTPKNFFWLSTVVSISKDSTNQHDGSVTPDLFLVNARDMRVIKISYSDPKLWVNEVRASYGLPLNKIDTIKRIDTLRQKVVIYDTVRASTPIITTPVVQTPEKKDTIKKEAITPVVSPIEVKKDTPIVKQPVVKPKQKTKKKKKG